MKATEIVEGILKDKGMTKSALARQCDTTLNTLSMRLKMDNISIDKLQEMLKALDYRLVIMPNDVRLPTGAKEID